MEFLPGVAEKLGFYVYELVDPVDGKVFYVGKGIGNRVHAHCAWADKSESEKSATIRQIRAETGRDPIHRIVAHDLSEQSAFLVEAVLIEHFGRDNLKNEVKGHDHSKLMLDVEEINAMYAAPTVLSTDISVPTLFVSLNGGRKGERFHDIKRDPAELQRRTTGIWKTADFRANAVRQIVGCYAGLGRVVYNVSGWDSAPHPKGPRKQFRAMGRNTTSPLIGARVVTPDGNCLTQFMYGKEKTYGGGSFENRSVSASKPAKPA